MTPQRKLEIWQLVEKRYNILEDGKSPLYLCVMLDYFLFEGMITPMEYDIFKHMIRAHLNHASTYGLYLRFASNTKKPQMITLEITRVVNFIRSKFIQFQIQQCKGEIANALIDTKL